MGSILVIKRDGSEEYFDRDKVAESIFGAAMSVGGEDMNLSDELADKVLDMLEANDVQEIASDDLQRIVEDTLINEGHATTARQYILKGADRKRIRELDTSLIQSFEELTFKSADESDTKRENGNIDSNTSMGTMLKYGSESAKSFNLSYLLSEDITEAHKNCDIHIHDLDFLALTSTCVCEDTLVTIKLNNEIKLVKVKDFEEILNINATVNVPVDISDMDIYIMSKGEFTKVNYYCKRGVGNRQILSIQSKCSSIQVTEDHKIPIEGNNLEARHIGCGDILTYPKVSLDRYTLDKIDLIDIFKHNQNIVIHNTPDVISNIKNIGNWKDFCAQIGYGTRANGIRYGKYYMTIQEYIDIEHFTSISREELKLAYKRTRRDTCIPAVLNLTKELGRFMGLMFSEGSIGESELSKQESNSKAACFCNYDKELIENFNACTKKVFNNIEIHDRKQRGKLAGTQLPGYLTYELFKGPLGVKNGAGDMSIPKWMFIANKDFISGFFGGYLDGDGNIQKDSYRLQLVSACKKFLEQLQYVLLLRGIGSEIVTVNTAGTVATFNSHEYGLRESVRNFDTHRLVLTGNLKDNIGWWDSLKVNKHELMNSDRDTNKYKKVSTIEIINNYNGYVYDFTTENHYFDANGVVVHNCDQIPIDKLFKGGFNTGHGFLREPGNIRTAAALTAIALQSNQNDQHGGQSIPMLDHYLSPYVALSYVDNIAKETKSKFDLTKANRKELKQELKSIWKEHKHLMNVSGNNMIKREIRKYLDSKGITYTESNLESILKNAYDDTYDDTFQAMEGLVHNLNTMHSRAGAQVPFSSVNYGTDLSQEGRIIQETILKTTWDGLGNGETPIFPIQILKLKKGINVDPEDPYYDIFELACKVSAKRLYPNFVNLDAPYNKELYVEGHPETEMATMGCRTRVGKNVYDPSKSVIPGRGNLSFTSINLPRLGIKANGNLDTFYKMLDAKMELVHKELLERLAIISRRRPINYPFLMGQNCWVDSEKLGPIDQINDVWKHGTLTVGFIGLAETLVALTGKHHGESEESQKLGLEIIGHMRQVTDKWSDEEKLNYSVIGTPAEGLSGRFIRADKKLFGIIPGVTDKGYYTNSSHVPVYYPISAKKKIDIEAPYHELENGGHILYIEMDGDPTKNVKAFMKVVRYMYDKNAGYMAINHAVDRDPVCGYVGIIDDMCPRCGRKDGEPMSIEMWNKLKGFANVGNADTLGYHGDAEEEMDRSSNKMDL